MTAVPSPTLPIRPAPATWRGAVEVADVERVRRLVDATGLFSPEEVAIAAELVEEGAANGKASGYEFEFVLENGGMTGYACYGRIPGSEVSFDLYWIAVHPDSQGRGYGRALLARTEDAVRAAGGRLLYAETSSSPAYRDTRAFYIATGFRKAAEFADFYRLGDGKIVYEKRLD